MIQNFIQNRIIRIKNLKHRKQGFTVLDGLNATFMSNRINTIIGKNGSGKTTILKILAGMENSGLVSGTIEMNDMDYFKNRFEVYESKILLSAPEHTLLDSNLTVYHLYRFIGRLYCEFTNQDTFSEKLDKKIGKILRKLKID